MKALSDFLAIILFFVTYSVTKNMILATTVAVIIGVIQAAYAWFKFKKLSPMQWVSLIVVVVFGGATILLKDSIYIMLKTTVICWITSLVILVMHLMGKNSVALLLQDGVKLPEKVYLNLTYAWIGFFFVMGMVNLAIAYPFTPEREAFWVNYKMYGYLPLTLVFSIAQAVYIIKYLPNEQTGE